ncbi:endonuclease III domain-containing protein [Infirmifilum sp.]|uniref:endonuclease III domain-containing protein n=1 Tax=Infirmifilum sp. TaxID=2856575 RepID=UPI003D1133B6
MSIDVSRVGSLEIPETAVEISRAAFKVIVSYWSLFKRRFPWRETMDPWAVLLAELLLIQTDAAKVATIFPELLKRIPSPCPPPREEELQELLRPLGLWRQRARTISAICAELSKRGCSVPCSYEELVRLPGIGPYVAAATAVVACGARLPVLDVNTARIISRVALGKDPGPRYSYDPLLRRLAERTPLGREELLAALDFAAQICTKKRPKCGVCPIRGMCKYYKSRAF